MEMGFQTKRLKGIPKNNLKSRIAYHRVKDLWPIHHNKVKTKEKAESIDVLIERLRFS
jgi:hypothetical protein